MEAQQFLAEFGHIANAPNGISQLRELVLVLAVTGRLLENSVSDSELAIELVTKIGRELADYKEAHKYRRSNGDDEPKQNIQFIAPPNWALTNLGQLGVLIRGVSYNKSVARDSAQDDFTGLLRANNIGAEVTFGELVYVPSKIVDSEQLLQAGDILIAMSSGSKDLVGKAALVRNANKYAFGAFCGVYRCMPSMDSEFVRVIMQSPIYRAYVSDQGKGIGINNLTKGHIEDYQFYLPPAEEQSRIVAKVDELMDLCDKLEAQQQARRKLQNNLRLSTLQAVAAASSPHELQAAWSRLADNFGRLFHAPDDVAGFKGLILDLAAAGHLLNIEHRHASTGEGLLEAIAAKRLAWSKESSGQEQKEALAMLKKLRTQQVTMPDAPLPEHWAWASLLQISQVIIDCDHKTPQYSEAGIHLIRTTDIRDGRMLLHSTRKISEESYRQRSRRLMPKNGDIFFTREAPMGEAAIVPDGEQVGLGQRLMLIRLLHEDFNNQFLLYVIRSPGFQIRMQAAAVGMTVKHINVDSVEDLVVPVPPKSEQDRIVAIVDELFRICDHYENQLAGKQKISTSFASSAVASITGIATDQQEEPMKAPQTELISPVRLGQAPDIKAQAPLATLLARHNGEMAARDLWQRFGGEIDAFYAQLKTEVTHGWVLEPEPAYVELKD